MIVKLMVDGGDMKPGPAVAQKIGPMGINMGKVIQDINKETVSFKGMKVPVELDVDAKTKNFTIKISTPPVAELLKKEIGLESGSGRAKIIKMGNASIEQIIKVAKTKQQGMLSKDLKAAVKSVVGSCVSLGILIENKEAKEIEKEISEGKFDKEIKEEREETSQEKRSQLDEHFAKVKAEQDMVLKKEEEAKAKEEEEKKAATAAAPAAGATPAATVAAPGAATAAPAAAGKKPAEAKKEAKKK